MSDFGLDARVAFPDPIGNGYGRRVVVPDEPAWHVAVRRLQAPSSWPWLALWRVAVLAMLLGIAWRLEVNARAETYQSQRIADILAEKLR